MGWVIEHKEPVISADVTQDPRYRYYAGQTFSIRSMIVEPLWAASEVTGALSVTSPALNAFTAEDQLLVRLLANCSAPAVERARLKRLTMFDHITMAFTHRYLYPRIAEEIDRAKRTGSPVSLLLIDLDHFKRVNDRYGHAAGDEALRLFAERVRANVRRIDILIRRGGEEFVLIMPATAAVQALASAERIQEQLSGQPLLLGAGVSLNQTVSIGVATWDGTESPERLAERADLAMYDAKRAGRDRVVASEPPPAVSSEHFNTLVDG
jgi:diguanylate cyclase (GGDEF)-like protein